MMLRSLLPFPSSNSRSIPHQRIQENEDSSSARVDLRFQVSEDLPGEGRQIAT